MNKQYNYRQVETKWQEVWEKTGIFNTDLESDKPKFYNLVMFPYPSADYIHIGHIFSYTGADVYGRFKKLQGNNVFEPMGFDAFGLPAENFAIKKGIHPKKVIDNAIDNSRRQLKESGFMFDWSREVTTSEPKYYKWTQWLFLQLYKQGLAYQKESPVNWCPSCMTVLANEQVKDGLCDRCDAEVIQKNMKQWFFKITDYAERLIKDLDKVDWPESSITKQRNWIGKSEGVQFKLKIQKEKGKNSEEIEVFTTRIDTVYGMTYVVLAPEHPLVSRITAESQRKEVEKYITQSQKQTEIERQSLEKEKTGVFTGAYAINPFNGEKVSIWIADYVLYGYGTGAVMAVPAHDERDYEFAKKYGLEIIEVIVPKEKKDSGQARMTEDSAFTGYGQLVDSAEFTGLTSEEAKKKMADWLEQKGLGSKKINYRLHDWSIGRQRYWGDPIPIVYCPKCGTVPVQEKDLPVELPEKIKDFRPKGTGKGPLASVKEFVETTCPKCGGKAERETDTMDTFVDSSFYYFRYPSVGNDEVMMDASVTKKWLPVDMYVGGAEHVTMHILYARFITKALNDAKLISFDEPFLKLRHQGYVLGADGKKMSKSKGNVVNPDEVVKAHGADAFRTYVLFMARFEDGGPWDPKGIVGIKRFLNRVWDYFSETKELLEKGNNFDKWLKGRTGKTDLKIKVSLNKTIKKVGEDIESFKFNTAISQLMVMLNEFYEVKINDGEVDKHKSLIDVDDFTRFLILLSPFAPHMAEELWEKMGGKDSISLEEWPKYDEKLIKDEMVTIAVQVNGKVRDQLVVNADAEENEVLELAKASDKVKKYIDGKEIKKVIYIKGKLLSLVVG